MDPVIHFEMPAEDSDRMRSFYEHAFGWQTTPLGPSVDDFVLAFTTESDPKTRIPSVRGAINGGFYRRAEPRETIRLTILVDDLPAAIERVERAGGQLVGGPIELPDVGLFATFADPEGNVVQLNQDFAVQRLPH